MRQEVQPTEDGRVFTPALKAEMKETRKYMLDRLVMLFAPTVMAWYYCGDRALRLILVAVVTAAACEYVGMKLVGVQPTLRDLSAATTGVVIALCLPAAAPMWLVVLATSFAILVAKVPFGTARSLLFSPAAAGLAFVTVCLPDYMFGYSVLPEVGGEVGVFGTQLFTPGVSLTQMLVNSSSIGDGLVNYIDVLVGGFAGPMGTGCLFALLGALLYMAVLRPKACTTAVSFLVTAAIFAFLFPRITTGRLQSVFIELCSGMLFFAALFLLPEEPLLPKRLYGRVLYGVSGGLICMLFRMFGEFEEGAVFAVLIANALLSVLNKLPLSGYERRVKKETRRKKRTKAASTTPITEGGAENV